MVGVERLFAKAGQLLLSSQRSGVLAGNCCHTFSCNPVGLSLVNSVRYNSNRASICKIGRLQYLRHYPTLVVNPDGSTFTIRYKEPRQIIKLPVDLSTVSEVEKLKHLERRRAKTRVSLEEDFDDVDFDSSKYLKLVKKK
ncbi:39S ribosomal protein L55, mitochondrial [Orchesella cincta]|uniref:39S ribosomal protein L55, mitochondrial n=1 Tax=Orchesella cincta TaxID=48709 RepID=A0A1D2MP76_ORCCI|nr:39S ribosomal protein L55, mitochondrial [Orchesella cincta]